MTQTPFDTFKKTCKEACHERHACKEGFRQMLDANNVSQMMATWRDNWPDVVDSKFADILCEKLPAIYPSIREEMNQAGIYLNECPENARSFVRVIVTNEKNPIFVYGEASAFIVGKAEVFAKDHAKVVNRKVVEAVINAEDYAVVYASKGFVNARNRATANISGDAVCHCYNSTKIYATGGIVHDHGHRTIEAFSNTNVIKE